MGGYERHSAPWALDEHLLDAIPPDFNGRLLEEDWPRFEEIAEQLLAGACRRWTRSPSRRLINGPEAFTPDNEFCLGESEVRGFFVAAGFCAHGLAGAGGIGQRDGRVDPRRRAVDRRLGDGHPPLRRALPLAQLHAQAHQGGLRDLLRHPLPRPRAPGRPAAAHLERLPLARRARRRVRREVGLGAGQLVRVERRARATSRCARAAGRGCTGRRRSAPSTAATRERAGLFDESSFAKLEIAGPGAAEFLERPVRQPRRARRRRDHLHADAQPPRRDRVRLHRHARRGGAVLDRHRHRVRQPRPQLDPPPRARTTAACAAPT